MSKTLEIIAFVQEAKSGNEIARQFGKPAYNTLKRLVEKGVAHKFKAFNEDSADKYARVVVTLYKATGHPYAGRASTSPPPSPRREYYRQWYESRKAKMTSNAS